MQKTCDLTSYAHHFKSTCNFLVVVKTRLFTKGKMQVFTDFSLDPIEEDISIAVGRKDILNPKP